MSGRRVAFSVSVAVCAGVALAVTAAPLWIAMIVVGVLAFVLTPLVLL